MMYPIFYYITLIFMYTVIIWWFCKKSIDKITEFQKFNVSLLPIVAFRPPGPNDKAALGTIWVYEPHNLAYIITSRVNNVSNWEIIVQGPKVYRDHSLIMIKKPEEIAGPLTLEITKINERLS